MRSLQRTAAGFAVSRRCDECGIRVNVEHESEEQCILKCSHCGKEYKFYVYHQPARIVQVRFMGA